MERLMIVREYVAEGESARSVLAIVGVSESTFYYKPKTGKRGRRATTTLEANGVVWTEERLVALITAELEREFVDYGYIKITKWLQRKHKLLINKRKVCRLMSKRGLLNGSPVRSRISKQWIKELVPNPRLPLTHLEFDVKNMYIHGSRRNAMMLTVLDVKSRFNVGWLLQWSIKKEDVVALLHDIQLTMPTVSKITVPSDNGSQYTFTDLRHANNVLTRWVLFYNHERIHSGVGYTSPAEYLTNHVSLPQALTSTTQLTSFSIN